MCISRVVAPLPPQSKYKRDSRRCLCWHRLKMATRPRRLWQVLPSPPPAVHFLSAVVNVSLWPSVDGNLQAVKVVGGRWQLLLSLSEAQKW